MAAALSLVLAADTLSIATMEIVDNLVMVVIPGAMEAGLENPLFWASMTFALGVAYLVAYPVNRLLLKRGKGHAIVQRYHHGAEAGEAKGWRRRIPTSEFSHARGAHSRVHAGWVHRSSRCTALRRDV